MESQNKIEILTGNCLDVLKQYPDNYFHSVVTDPPYGLGKEPDPVLVLQSWIEKGYHEIKGKGFMGKAWDAFVPQPIVFKEIFRVLRPGGHILCACGTRTQDWMAMSLRFAGFEIRDVITWHYGSGFPKSLNISKAIDDYFGAEREVVGQNADILNKQAKDLREGKRKITDSLNNGAPERNNGFKTVTADITAPSTDAAKQFDGWGTALKPATEFFTLARKPISEKTVAQNVLKWGTGGINISGCEIGFTSEEDYEETKNKNQHADFNSNDGIRVPTKGIYSGDDRPPENYESTGRFPANVMFDEHTAELLDQQSGITTSSGGAGNKSMGGLGKNGKYGKYALNIEAANKGGLGDTGGASRFFYIAKASTSERNKGLEDLGFKKEMGHSRFDTCKNCGGYMLQGPDRDSGCTCENPEREHLIVEGNFHPTVKPVKLMCELVKMITPKGGICLDPFCGSGTTGVACKVENLDAVLIDMEPDYTEISKHRVAAWIPEKDIKEQLKKPEPKIKEQTTFEFPE